MNPISILNEKMESKEIRNTAMSVHVQMSLYDLCKMKHFHLKHIECIPGARLSSAHYEIAYLKTKHVHMLGVPAASTKTFEQNR